MALSPVAAHCQQAAPGRSPQIDIQTRASGGPDVVMLAGGGQLSIVVDTGEATVVGLAAGLFADDIRRVTGSHPRVAHEPATPEAVIAGTLGQSRWIDRLAAAGKLRSLSRIRGRWEATLWQVVENPFPGVRRALVIVGSDRRGTAYGLMGLSSRIGVSPWYWWADVPVARHPVLGIRVASPQVDSPAVRYRGFFINDEDWGLNPWAKYTFDTTLGNIGPKTYQKVFELLLRLRLNYIWPAMHACSTEFGSDPENYLLADQYGIVAGSSHCEPLLCNNVKWDEKVSGPWNYSLNADTIHAYWEQMVRARSSEEAVWTLGIRGIHDRAMETPPTDMPGKLELVSRVFRDQRALIDRYVTHRWGPVPECFVPYKEVLPIYDAGLKVPEDVTLVWVDDNFGYIRRLSGPVEQRRSGGSGIYWHLSYYGGPHSYTWINTTAPALMWEELHKAWENNTRRLWVVNVGDIKPMEIGIDYLSRLAWDPGATGPGSQPIFLRRFARENFGNAFAAPIADLLAEYYRLGTIRKPELMDRTWALSLPAGRAGELTHRYRALLAADSSLFSRVPHAARDAYEELVGFPARVLAATGLIFMADRAARRGEDPAARHAEIDSLRAYLEAQVRHYNTGIAGGKWNRIMPGLVTGKQLPAWSSQVRWPWGEAAQSRPIPELIPSAPGWRAACAGAPPKGKSVRGWREVPGLGTSGRAMALLPADSTACWSPGDPKAPRLVYRFRSAGADTAAYLDFVPTFRLYPGLKLHVSVQVDGLASRMVEVPGSSGREDEGGFIRRNAVQDNYVRVRVPLVGLSAGSHTFTIAAVDPGAVIDRVWLP